MQFEIRRKPGYLDVTVHGRESARETQFAVQEILDAQKREGISRILICVTGSRPIFRVEEYRLSDAFARLAGIPGLRVALVSDTPELFASHEYIEMLASGRGLECKAFRTKEEALQWLVPESCASPAHAGGGAVGPQEDDERIDPQRDDQVEQWSHRLGCSKEALRRAAELAGPRIGDIRQRLRS